MKIYDKVVAGAGAAVSFAGGVVLVVGSLIVTMAVLIIWGVSGSVGVFSSVFLALFGAIPLVTGIFLIRRGIVLKQVLAARLENDKVRRIAFEHHGRLRPIDLAKEMGCTENEARDILSNLAAQDTSQIELDLDFDTGDLFFDFIDIKRLSDHQRSYQSPSHAAPVQKTAIDYAILIRKTVDAFLNYGNDPKERQRRQVERYLDRINQKRRSG